MTTHCVDCGPTLPIYWGLSALATLTGAQVVALQYQRLSSTHLGTYEFTDEAASRYLYVAMPAAFEFVDSFTTEGYLDLVPISSLVDVPSGNTQVSYRVYRSLHLQNATGITLEVD